MSVNNEIFNIDELRRLPLMPLRGMVVYPYMIVHLDVGRETSIAAVEQAMSENDLLMLAAQKDENVDNPELSDMYRIGTVVKIKQMIKIKGGAIRILIEGIHRASIVNMFEERNYLEADVRIFPDDNVNANNAGIELEALNRSVTKEFGNWVKYNRNIPEEAKLSITMLDDYGQMADVIASHLDLEIGRRQYILECIDVKARLETLLGILKHETELQSYEKELEAKVRKQMDKLQKEYYLREKIKVFRKELGEDEDIHSDIDDFKKRLAEGNYPEQVQEAVNKEMRRLERASFSSQEASVITTYVETLLTVPWRIHTKDNLDVSRASRVLDKDHYGLEKVKDRILEYLSVRTLADKLNAPILCLVGPPGVGKTSLASSVARAMNRKFVRQSLGGVNDEAEIRGHRRTYVGAMPGRIIEGMRKAGTCNPVFLLDEIDKMASNYKGDPTSAMLEVLDPAQNNTFSDHYVEIPFDLSNVLWIVTANNLGNIPRPLRDRMEIITISSYTEWEKAEIAKRYLVPKQREANGLSAKNLRFGPGVINKIIDEYTRESGVRELERMIGRACRRSARRIVEDGIETVSINTKNITDFLDKAIFPHRKESRKSEVGLCTGMAWTEVGGDTLPVEVNIFPGKGELLLTGKLGDVMQESAQAALSCIRTRYEKLGLAKDFYDKLTIHVHVPEGATPKDGPSAGITMATAMVSALTNRAVKGTVAMTGEITIRGKVLPIGGLKEKVLAAYSEGIRTIVLPKDNERDIEELPEQVREVMEFCPVETVDQVLEKALVETVDQVQDKAPVETVDQVQEKAPVEAADK